MKRIKLAGGLTLALGVVALIALAGIAAANGRGEDHGHHHHHFHHRFVAPTGTVSSFETTTGKLTIALADGESITGMVDEHTRIKCEGFDNGLHRRDHGEAGNGRGPVEPGDDHGNGPRPSGEGGTEGEATSCVAMLVPGAEVFDAELALEGGSAVFDEVDLGHGS